ncbi:hypothetical protein BDL97_04G012400 [Sphagnum fallax]|nr:hypothetical protein BDL97_04G012400 [Sphagnum fallax]
MMKAVVEAGIRRLLQRSSNSCSGVHELRALKNCYSSRSSSSARRPSRQPTASNRNSSKTGAASIRQQRVASEIRAVVAMALQQGACNAALLARCGFEIQEVKMSGDLRKAFVLWRAMPGMQRTVEKEINAAGKQMRSMVFEQLSMPFSPAIVFCEDKPNLRAQAIEEVLSRLDEEEDK